MLKASVKMWAIVVIKRHWWKHNISRVDWKRYLPLNII